MVNLDDLQNEIDVIDNKEIHEMLSVWQKIDKVRGIINKMDDAIRIKIKAYLKERKWDRYLDNETQIGVTLSMVKRRVFDEKQLKLMLSDAQMAQVIRTTTSERMSIVTPETRERLKKYVKTKKQKI